MLTEKNRDSNNPIICLTEPSEGAIVGVQSATGVKIDNKQFQVDANDLIVDLPTDMSFSVLFFPLNR